VTKAEKLDRLVKITNVFNYIGLVVMFVLPLFMGLEGVAGSVLMYFFVGTILGLLIKDFGFLKMLFFWLPTLGNQKVHNYIFK